MASSTSSPSLPLFSFQKGQNLTATQFVWPKEDVIQAQEVLNAPIIDISGFLANDKAATAATAELLRAACMDRSSMIKGMKILNTPKITITAKCKQTLANKSEQTRVFPMLN